MGHFYLDGELLAASAKYFRSGGDRAPTPEAVAAHYRERNLAAVVFKASTPGTWFEVERAWAIVARAASVFAVAMASIGLKVRLHRR
jgi:hypothetical protein